jgi:polar amino acid transport system substrate-binding protein
VGILLWIAAVCAALSTKAALPTADRAGGFYTNGQARIGAQLYQTNCARCHGGELQGLRGKAPALIGPSMRARHWKLSLLLWYVSREMPADARGSLTQREYLAVMSLLLQRNGHPAGRHMLSRALLQNLPDRL